MILLFNRSFYPDTEATGQFMTDLAKDLAQSFPITVICGRSYFVPIKFKPVQLIQTQEYNRVKIIRVRHTNFWKGSFLGRITNWFSYIILAFFASLWQQPRFVLVNTDPPLLGFMGLLLKKIVCCKLIYNCQDLYSDAATAVGFVPAWFARSFDALDRRAFLGSDLIVVLGNDMAERIATKGVPRKRMIVIPSHVDTSKISPVAPDQNPYLRMPELQKRFIFMYSGNFGLMQDFETILKAASELNIDRSKWMLLFVGSGVTRAPVEDSIKSLGINNVIFLPPQPRENLSALLSSGTIHFVPLKKGTSGIVVPSKIYGIMAAARPYLAICDSSCDMARIAQDGGCGLWAPAGDIASVREKMLWAIKNRDKIEKMGKRARELAIREFETSVVHAQWISLFKKLYNR